uniref:ATP synthase F0 subunit 6 n=1 Tax=Ciconiphilus decimfasciatus TaxID=2212705 RepID=UPI00257A0112|nr:ATP synthase F0 subunit 6 [Ciconiphilus decimfasciatus]WGW14985.1 ATP synthase subunit 6 [Ciconiphilus decimfasciatus]
MFTMMTSLMSIFDPSTNVMTSNWLIVISFLFLPLNFYWKSLSFVQFSVFFLIKQLCCLFKNSMKTELIFVSLFTYLFFLNSIGLMPYMFSTTSHFLFNFFLGLPLWMSTMLWGLINNFVHNTAHLTPMGCPDVLVPFMVMVESISSLIRPLTISLRLMANMLAGHMILTMLSLGACNLWFLPLFFVNLMFFLFEMTVVFIQTYVFSMLMSLYWMETE